MSNPVSFKRHNLPVTLVFTFAPAIFMLLAPYGLAQLDPLGKTIVLSSYFLIEAVLLLTIIWLVARKESSTIGAVIGYNRRVPSAVFLVLAAVGAGYAIYLRDYFSPPALREFSMSLMQAVPAWPSSIFARLPQHDAFFDRLGAIGVAGALVIGMISVAAASLMQTVYFRGFLLSRLDHWGVAAPIAITALFVMFHLGSPWFWPQFLLFTALWAFIAYFTKNVWIVAVSHVAMNTYSYVLALGAMAAGAGD